MDLKNRSILITGATGFLGSHLTRRLARLGTKVHAWSATSSRLWRLADVKDQIALSQVDIRDLAQVRQACRSLQPELVFHLAAYGVNHDEKDIPTAVDVNVRGTTHLLEALRGSGCRRIITTGTWAEYGPKDHPARETDPLEPVGIYGCTKAAATTIALGIAAREKLPLIVLRPFSVYGPGEGSHKFVPIVIQACLKRESPRLTSCRQVRDYVYVEDVVEAYLRAAEADLSMPAVINIGSGSPVELKQIVSAVTAHFEGIQPAFGAIPDRQNEIWRIEADITNAKKRLGWQPAFPLEKGIALTVDWFRKNTNGKN